MFFRHSIRCEKTKSCQVAKKFSRCKLFLHKKNILKINVTIFILYFLYIFLHLVLHSSFSFFFRQFLNCFELFSSIQIKFFEIFSALFCFKLSIFELIIPVLLIINKLLPNFLFLDLLLGNPSKSKKGIIRA